MDKFGCWTKVFRHKLWVSAEKSATVAPVLENFDHIVGPQFSRKISEIWANLLVAFVFSQNCANFHAISISQKAENFLAVKNSRKLCKFPGHPILDFNLPGRRPICTSVIPPPPVFSAADNCELTERPHKCLDSDTTALIYIFHHQRRDIRHRIF